MQFDEKTFFESLGDVVRNLQQLTAVADSQLRQSTEIVAALRGHVNGLLWSGMIQLQGSAGNWSYENDFQVPYSAVGFIDSLAAGPYTISVDAMGGTNGPGTFLTGDTLAATIPLVGQHLSITSTSDSDTAPQLFIAVFTENRPLVAH